MQFRNLGSSGLHLSVIGLGGGNFGGRIPVEMDPKILDAVFDFGINFIDTADKYGGGGRSEQALGRLLGPRRKEIILATKFGKQLDKAGMLRGASRRYIMLAVENSLRRLKTDWIDLYQLHEPDPQTPIEETLRALDDLVQQGKVRYIGHSNFAGWEVANAHWQSRLSGTVPFISSQSEYNLLNRDVERELLPAVRAYGLGLLPYFPLAAGALTGKFRRGTPLPSGVRLATPGGPSVRYRQDSVWPVVEELEQFCAQRGHTILELAVNWLLAQRNVCCVMAGVSSPQQLEQNVKAVGWVLSPEDLTEIDLITLGKE